MLIAYHINGNWQELSRATSPHHFCWKIKLASNFLITWFFPAQICVPTNKWDWCLEFDGGKSSLANRLAFIVRNKYLVWSTHSRGSVRSKTLTRTQETAVSSHSILHASSSRKKKHGRMTMINNQKSLNFSRAFREFRALYTCGWKEIYPKLRILLLGLHPWQFE